MLVKYWLPVAVLLAAQVVWTSWAEGPATASLNSDESKEVGDSSDLEAQELFLRPVVIKYGHDHPAVYTWQGGSSTGQGWGVYKAPQSTGLQQGGQQGWGWPPKKGWGQGKKKKKKGKKKKKKGKKKKKKGKKKKNKAWGKKSKGGGKKKGGGEEGGWGQVEESGWGGGDDGGDKKGGKKKGGEGGWGDDDDDDGGGWGEGEGKKKKGGKKKKKGGGGWGDDDDDDDGGWSRSRQQNEQYRFNLAQGVQRFGGPADTVEYIPVVPADALPFQGFDGYFQDAYIVQ
ncbi:unnamed protein product [Orchesella dallaii]|uniref:Uncharacterized protein n=1 Tax=Orchesella dallaii TaxID=48710 RepID=A0ABP1PRC8_9HEXA